MTEAQSSDAEYPYIVETGLDGNTRMRVESFVRINEGDVEQALRMFGMLQDTPPTYEQRLALVTYVRFRIFYPRRSYCVVWSKTSCTYVSVNGPAIDCHQPPFANRCDPRDYDRVRFQPVDCAIVDLPKGRFVEHLSLRLLDGDLVEVSSASPAMIGHLDEIPPSGVDPILPFLDEDGEFVPPTHFRGVEVTGVMEGPILLGPIQPDGTSSFVVRRWPSDVWDACRRVAQGPLNKQVLLAAWNAVAPQDGGTHHAGFLLAA